MKTLRASPHHRNSAADGDDPKTPAGKLHSQALVVFAALWALATLFHQAGWPRNHTGLETYLLSLMAVGVLLRPASTNRFLALLVVQVGVILYHLPGRVTNHWLLSGLVATTILVAWVSIAARQRSVRVSPAALFESFAPAVRLQLIILYFYAVLHKLNTDFLNPVVSCATEHYVRLASTLPFLPTGSLFQYGAIYGTLLIEVAIPVLLCIPRTRIYAVALGTSFHLGLIFDRRWVFYDFSSLVYALYFLFIPLALLVGARAEAHRHKALRHWLDRMRAPWFQRAVRTALLTLGGLLVLAAAYEQLTAISPATYRIVHLLVRDGARVPFLVYAIVALMALALAWRSRSTYREIPTGSLLRVRNAAAVVVPIVFLNGLSPYFGLKTETSFSMFSNLSTEGGRTNHLFMPVRYRLASYQEDLVSVESSTIPRLQRVADSGRQITFFEFRSLTSANPEHAVSYVRDGSRYVVAEIGAVPELATPIPTLQRKFLRFREIASTPEGTPCTH